MTRPDDDIELSPLGESGFAVEHGFVRSAPDVSIVGAAVRQARREAGLTTADVAREMTRRGYTVDPAGIGEVEDAAAYRMRPREARLLAAIVGQPLGAIEATAEPWPADADDLESVRDAGAPVVMLGNEVVVRTGTGSYLGLLRCTGDASVLDSRTYRLVAASLLNGSWSHLAGALLVTAAPPHLALAVDALDCVARAHAPSGLSGFSRLAAPEPVARALASYDRAYAISWTDPEPLARLLTPAGQDDGTLTAGIATEARRLADQARRARQPGKRPGYEAVATWLAEARPPDVAALLDELATQDPEGARRRLEEVLAP